MGSYGHKEGNPLSNFEKLLRMKAETFSLIRVKCGGQWGRYGLKQGDPLSKNSKDLSIKAEE